MLAGGLLTACSSDEPGKLSEPAPASFSARIGDAVSRVAGSEWSAGDAIGISGVSGAKSYSNVRYITAQGDGNFTAVGAGIYYNDMEDVFFTAYYPHTDAIGENGLIAATVGGQGSPEEYDFLWAQATGSYAAPDVSFGFSHRMSSLALTFTNGNDVDLSAMSFSIDGLILDGTFNTATGEARTLDGAATSVLRVASMDESSMDESSSRLIVFPQTASPLVISATVEGQTYKTDLSLGDLTPGYNYSISITVRKTGMTVAGCTITPWGKGGDNEAELDPTVCIGDKRPADAAIGDFYMNDGSLVDKGATLTADQKAACIGIVFTTDPDRIGAGAKAALAAKGVAPHGLVMALANATSDKPCWSNNEIDEPGLTETDNLQKMYQNVDGYTETRQIFDSYDDITLETSYPAFHIVSRYGMAGTDSDKYTAPGKSTGWFMPSIGQWWDIMRNLGNVEALDAYKDNTSKSYIRLDGEGKKARDNINNYLTKIPGSHAMGRNDGFWTSSEINEENVVCVDYVSDGSFYFNRNYKTMLIYYVRCVLAF